jgi:hypothetical protein
MIIDQNNLIPYYSQLKSWLIEQGVLKLKINFQLNRNYQKLLDWHGQLFGKQFKILLTWAIGIGNDGWEKLSLIGQRKKTIGWNFRTRHIK